MFAKAFVFASALVGAEAFAAFGASPALGLRKAPTAGMSTRTAPSQTVVMGTFMEEFKFRKVANRFTFKVRASPLPSHSRTVRTTQCVAERPIPVGGARSAPGRPGATEVFLFNIYGPHATSAPHRFLCTLII
ncbi:hypothetical protein T484DRAFT_2748752 [Baffinella frigidus]|nr:hypothetical protein T484DRAFT_2748752 [Cryptophyta sp. CCMP2293]